LISFGEIWKFLKEATLLDIREVGLAEGVQVQEEAVAVAVVVVVVVVVEDTPL
jgi:hypothetical protein